MRGLFSSYIQKSLPYFPILLLLLNVFTKFLYLTTDAICLDEPFSIYHAQFALSTLIKQLANYNNPPLFEIVLHFWIKLFGISPFAVRTLPALFACLCPVLLYYFAKRNFSIRAGIASSLLLTFSGLFLFYSHDCRVYSLFVLLSLASFYYFFEVINTSRRTLIKQILFVASSTLLIYAHYFGFFILFFQGLYLLLCNRKSFYRMSLNYLIVLVLYLPCIFTMIKRFGETSKGNWIPKPEGIDTLYNMLWSFSNFPFIAVSCIGILVFALIKALINKSYLRTKENSPAILILLWFLIPFFGMFFISYWIPMYISRYLIFAIPAYYILLVLSVENLLKNNTYCNALLAILVLCFAFTIELNSTKTEPIRDAVKVIKQHKDKNTLVIIGSEDMLPNVAYHYNRNYFSSISDGKEYHLTDSLLKADDVYCTYNTAEIKQLQTGKFTKVIYLATDEKSNSPDYPMLKGINAHYCFAKQEELGSDSWHLSFYNWCKH